VLDYTQEAFLPDATPTNSSQKEEPGRLQQTFCYRPSRRRDLEQFLFLTRRQRAWSARRLVVPFFFGTDLYLSHLRFDLIKHQSNKPESVSVAHIQFLWMGSNDRITPSNLAGVYSFK
jgi:hypothetical protein